MVTRFAMSLGGHPVHELLSLTYSPWSVAARWCLRYAEIPVTHVEYKPMVGEPGLRRRLRARGPVSVPVLFDSDGGAHQGALEIARWVQAQRPECGHIPAALRADVEAWSERAQRAMGAGRVRVAAAVVQDPEALGESVPPALMPIAALRPLVGRIGARFLASKYGFDETDCDAALDEALGAFRARVDAGGGVEPLLGAFSFADVMMVCAMQFIAPLPDERVPLGRAARAHWCDPERADPVLVAWRDAMVERYWDASA